MATNPPPPGGHDPHGPHAQSPGGFAQGSVRTGALQGRDDRGHKPFFLTSEFLTLVVTAVALLIAAAVADNFEAPHVWTLITVLAFAYIVSRGLAKRESR